MSENYKDNKSPNVFSEIEYLGEEGDGGANLSGGSGYGDGGKGNNGKGELYLYDDVSESFLTNDKKIMLYI